MSYQFNTAPKSYRGKYAIFMQINGKSGEYIETDVTKSVCKTTQMLYAGTHCSTHCSTPLHIALHIALRCYTNKLIGNGRLSLAGEYLQLHVTVGTDDLVMALFPLAVPLGCVLFTRVQDTVCTLFV